MSCYDSVFELVFEAQKKLGKFIGNADKLEAICKKIDSVAEEFESEYIDVVIDDIHSVLLISFDCEEMIIHGKNHELYEVANEASRLSFTQTKKGLVKTEFAFVGLWENKSER